jgi:D-arabinose 1-dehydrogenase-like Zn-dependent alcohol dehydrogenase
MPDTHPSIYYQIHLEGYLDQQWAEWFDGMSINQENGKTVLTGPVADQAALHGLLKKVRDLGMPLVSLTQIKPDLYQYNKDSTMKIITFEQYGSPDVLQLKETAKPIPANDQVLIKIYSTAANPLDWHRMRADPFLVRLSQGFWKPQNPTLGADIAGVVEAVGRDVREFKPGDEVFGSIGSGGFAEYALAKEKQVAHKPANVSFEGAASVGVVGFTAIQGMRDFGQIRAGQKVLVNGASGGIGTFAVQICQSDGN